MGKIVHAVEINVLSGAAVEPGLHAAADIYRKQTGNQVKIAFATTPEMRRLVGEGVAPDVWIAPPAALDEFATSGRVDAAARVLLGRVGVGVAIRDGARKPDVSTVDAFKRAVLDADAVIYNRASSGLYVEALLQRLGLAEQIQAKTRRYIGTDMIGPLINGQGREIGFMPVVQILNWRGRGLQLAGPLPADIQHHTTYAAAPAPGSAGGLGFVRYLGTPEAKAVFARAGVE
ncbi:substrate-binding domain-containing protein [Rhodoplanes sp. Z2-YC6860]|uniref:substrate-binding domain-containing protein n=1 Tax=Rhodoplanes sp. Z2-YC6860 TaxID=674703 RepID=UPI00078B4485|nr:substrate-binding domain-containing protein [Rhodoplanes sp. Z2-YC6860]AMN40303.1 molybdate transport system substrate-binding protein [Rhodoplanes sp. Z2-YC6860]